MREGELVPGKGVCVTVWGCSEGSDRDRVSGKGKTLDSWRVGDGALEEGGR